MEATILDSKREMMKELDDIIVEEYCIISQRDTGYNDVSDGHIQTGVLDHCHLLIVVHLYRCTPTNVQLKSKSFVNKSEMSWE